MSFETQDISGMSFLAERQCPGCISKRDVEREKRSSRGANRNRDELVEAFNRQFDRMTPERLRTPDTNHPAFNRDLWRKLQLWNPTKDLPWLGLVGETGACKTRCALLRVRLIVISHAEEWAGYRDAPKFDAMLLTGMEFNRYAVEQYSKVPGETRFNGRTASLGEIAASRLAEARKTKLLILDEIGKVRPSTGTIEELFSLIDYRTSRNLVTIWTSNTPPERFCTSWPEEYASPGCGRIIEASTIIHV